MHLGNATMSGISAVFVPLSLFGPLLTLSAVIAERYSLDRIIFNKRRFVNNV